MLKKLKTFLTKVKNFFIAIEYRRVLELIIELSILIMILININLITIIAKDYFDIIKYCVSTILLFALGFAIYKK